MAIKIETKDLLHVSAELNGIISAGSDIIRACERINTTLEKVAFGDSDILRACAGTEVVEKEQSKKGKVFSALSERPYALTNQALSRIAGCSSHTVYSYICEFRKEGHNIVTISTGKHKRKYKLKKRGARNV